MNYVGEHTWVGQLGHSLTVISFIGALLATVSYALGTQRRDDRWTALGRLAFRGHSVAVLGIVTVLFVMLFNHWFQYDYVWKHSNLAMPMKFIASCFWEGQEGSFLLWTFWHVVLGNILIFRTGRWEAPVMAVVAAVQVFLATMLLGVYIGEVRIGSSPFLLIRELPENIGSPWTRLPEYISRIPELADGRGLNPLLQNYWMVIHPPTLFLGFAATLVPFAYAIAGLWTGERRSWMTPALPWAFFGVGALGAGILMGGAWAYEALSFGGFWAWDPVENASLVPWLTLVAAGHLMLVNRRKETSLYSTFLLTLGTFIFVLYSTFLTRSGVLGDTSVHSFTGDGMLPGLLIFMLFFVALSTAMMGSDRGRRAFYALVCGALLLIGTLLHVEVPALVLFVIVSIGMLVKAYRTDFLDAEEEEALWSREFWLFMGALVLLLSSLQITFSTSIPVFNMLLEPFGEFFGRVGRWLGSDAIAGLADTRLAPPTEPIPHYNKWQLPFAFIVTILVAFTQYLRWRKSDGRRVLRALVVPFLLALAITIAFSLLLEFRLVEMNLIALLFSTAFAAVANAAYIPAVLKGSLRHAGPSVAHLGFGLLLLGALISTGRKTEMSRNTKGMDLRFLNENFSNNANILLYRGDTVRMGDFHVTFHSKRHEGHNLYYDMDYFSVEPMTYHAGDTVRAGDMLFRATNDHQAGEHFVADQPAHWEPIEHITKRQLWNAREWTSVRPGKKLFALAPYLQLNERMGNVPEPSTKHWLHRDLYTHIRYADMATDVDSANIGWMPDRRYDKVLGDTIVTPTSVAIIDSVYIKRDSLTLAMLGEAFTVYAVDLRIRDLYRSDRWFSASPLVIYANGEPVAGKHGEVPALRVRYGLGTVTGDVNDPASVKVGIDVAESEFVVMQAIVFPGINILWLGCVLMLIGTAMAVWQRVRGASQES